MINRFSLVKLVKTCELLQNLRS